jgi:hypothetical protein
MSTDTTFYQGSTSNTRAVVGALTIPSGYNSTNVTAVDIGTTVTSIPNTLFQFFVLLDQVTFQPGSTLATIGQQAFNGADILPSIHIPSSVTTIGDNAFSYTYSLAEVIFDTTGALPTMTNVTAFQWSACAAFYYTGTTSVLYNTLTTFGGKNDVIIHNYIPNTTDYTAYTAKIIVDGSLTGGDVTPATPILITAYQMFNNTGGPDTPSANITDTYSFLPFQNLYGTYTGWDNNSTSTVVTIKCYIKNSDYSSDITNGFRIQLDRPTTTQLYIKKLTIKQLNSSASVIETWIFDTIDNTTNTEYSTVGVNGGNVGWIDGIGSYPRYRWFNIVPAASPLKKVTINVTAADVTSAGSVGPLIIKLYSKSSPHALNMGGNINLNVWGGNLQLNNGDTIARNTTSTTTCYMKSNVGYNAWNNGDMFIANLVNTNNDAFEISDISLNYNGTDYSYTIVNNDYDENQMGCDNTVGWLSAEASDGKPMSRWYRLIETGWNMFGNNTYQQWSSAKIDWGLANYTVFETIYALTGTTIPEGTTLTTANWTAILINGSDPYLFPNTVYWVNVTG